MRIGKIATGAVYRTDEEFQNVLILEILSFPSWKNSESLLIF